ncbi:lipoyl synthase [Halomonas denitrificans]|uniref:lipoyl synthase n=1 Tax=Halomonas TaxID=2745 RepID=UPI001A8BFBD7|nr:MULTISPECIES: lipoyl synthase [Halomonas]MBN8413470.1 lipoyl synthase [Halomonas litopenaei]MBY5926072.1 lipoyl synthase [Halomonas sp. DP4Y7-2]MBY5931107.1 lipoyl synthase [Halomonas sp. DP8Y7-3]MBY5969011.1 lipoyl synthase [Halomonas denitrificans]MBY5984628.1 lipoyl synthase [Halomonas sp. DP5Y7-2]
MTDSSAIQAAAAAAKAKKSARSERGVKLRGAEKVARIPVKVIPTEEIPRKPDWLRVRMPVSKEVTRIKDTLRRHGLHTVCEEASCPNLGECFHGGTATFMIMGDICTRRCPFCDVAHGRPNALNEREPRELAEAIAEMRLKYVVVTSVDRDDLRDGGAQHFADCIREIRRDSPSIEIEVLVPDFRGRMEVALDILETTPPNVFNHNLETVPSLYRKVRPGADYQWSLDLLKGYKERRPEVMTKSGLMLGVGEADEQVIEVMKDLRAHNVDMLTLGQYMQPSRNHLPVDRWVPPATFDWFAEQGRAMGFTHVASGPLVRSSYHADQQAHGIEVK